MNPRWGDGTLAYRIVESMGRTLEEAIRRGLDYLGLTEDEVIVEVLEEGSAGLLGLGRRPFRVRIRPREDPEERLLRTVIEDAVEVAEQFEAEAPAEETAAEQEEVESASTEESADGRVEVQLSRDRMEARVTLIGPKGKGRPPTLDDVRRALEAHGVVYGVDLQEVRAALASGLWGTTVTVARGTPPQPGEDARVQYEVPVDPRGRPAVLEDGRVDYYDMGIVHSVREGQLLARKVPATEGTPGTTVTGEKVPAKPGRDVRLLVGKGAELDPDGVSVRAAMDGAVMIDARGRITVMPVYELKGDVDFSTGNIEFVGSVIVRGMVRRGLRVQAEGSVEVHGGVDGASITAGGDVLVRHGIQGAGRGQVTAAGSVICSFIENATVRAGKDVMARRGIMYSDVTAGGKVMVTERRGVIVGGVVRAGEEIHAKVVGSALGTPTELEVGVDPKLRIQLNELSRKIEANSEALLKIERALDLLKEREREGRALSQDQLAARLKLARAQRRLREQLDELRQREQELSEIVARARRGRIKASEVILPGVRVTIGASSMVVTEEIPRCMLYLGLDGQIAVGKYS